MVGRKFGKLTVVKLDHIDETGEFHWECHCACTSGKVKVMRGGSLRNGHLIGSCGCVNPCRLRPYEALYRRMKRTNTGELRTLEFGLTYEEFLTFTKEPVCFYCLIPLVWKEFTSTRYGYNLDRKDNDRGYIKDNLVVCCKRCNMGKRDTYSFEEWYGMTAYFR
jgi:hypothetical protein